MATSQHTNGTAAPVPVASSSTPAAGGKPAVQPSEVGWLFVPQYYTFLNQNPGRLHCFYTKKSTLTHGTEQEEEKMYFGQQEIHNKITSLGFQDCKVYVSNVDAQSSASGGIVIQVLGEMSNKAGPWRKFAQTFFLAEQPNGYFVLNDIFRYLKEDEETEEQAEEIEADIEKDEAVAAVEGHDVAGAKVDISAVSQPGATPHVQPVLASSEQASAPAIAAAPTDSSVTAPEEPVEETSSAAVDVSATEAVSEVPSSTAPVEETEAPASTPAAAAPAAVAEPAKAPEVPAGPPKPKTWANLAASNATIWGSAVRSDAKGVSSAAAPAVTTSRPAAAAAAAATATATPASGSAPTAQAGKPPREFNHASSAFIKNVLPEHVSEAALRSALEAEFGPLSGMQVLPQKSCAFADFPSVDIARKAIQTSASRGGFVVGANGWKVSIEEKKKPSDRGAGAGRGGRTGADGARGGGAPRGAGRGSGRGGASAGRGRGGAQV